MKTAQHWLVTGIPRSGTTLLGHLISQLQNCHCLSEPDAVDQAARQASSSVAFGHWLKNYLDATRNALLQQGQVTDRISTDGAALTNYFDRSQAGAMQVRFTVAARAVHISQPEHFVLAVKQNAPLLAPLPALAGQAHWQIWAIMRHPVATLLSWRSLQLPVSQGRLPAGENLWPELAEHGRSGEPLLVRLAQLYELLLQRLWQQRQHLHWLSYETLLAAPEQLAQRTGHAYTEITALRPPAREQIYPWHEQAAIIAALQQHAPLSCQIYPDLQHVHTPPHPDWQAATVAQSLRLRESA